jgi:Ca2+/Na+ antiporter
MIYFFYGVGVVSDYFMAGIETITSKKTLVKHKRTDRYVTVKVWNVTVANLSLMALGSSAPEIMLSLVETLLNDFYSGELGPSTIVGSAAFNLFAIIAVCIFSIPSWEVRRIKELDVFHITAVFSIFAYVWLLLIVTVITPDVIDVAESAATIVFFPLLVTICFMADRGIKPFTKKVEEVEDESGQLQRAVTAIKTAYDEHNTHPRARSVLVHRVQIEHAAAIHHEERCEKMGSMKSGRGSQIGLGTEKTIMLPAGEPVPAGDDGEVLRDFYGNAVTNDSGVITFCRDVQEVEGGDKEVKVQVYVLRRNGATGDVQCKFHAEHMTAFPGYDYREPYNGSEDFGILAFPDGVCMATIELTVLPVRPLEDDERFQIILSEAAGGAIFNPNDDGGKDNGVLTIVIKNTLQDPKPSLMDRCVNVDVVGFGWDVWKEQVMNALVIERMADDDEDPPEEPSAPTVLDYVVYGLSMPWKLFYAITTPPPEWFGGWFLFGVALFHVGLLTAVICDLASLFGCVLDISDLVTAIVVVAPGTSLPDLFASTTAAKEDDDADASIVNVTGSNSVNVFLGIGLSWFMCSIYWAGADVPDKWKGKYPDIYKDYPNGAFVVKGGAMAFSVMVFSCCSVVALCILRGRRTIFDGELGGPPHIKNCSAVVLFSLYVLYSGLSIWKSSSDDADVFQWILLVIAVLSVIGLIGAEALHKAGKIEGWRAPEEEEAGKAASDNKGAEGRLEMVEEEESQSRPLTEATDATADSPAKPEATPEDPPPDQIGRINTADVSYSPRGQNSQQLNDKNIVNEESGEGVSTSPDAAKSNRFKKKTTRPDGLKSATPGGEKASKDDPKFKAKKVTTKKKSGVTVGQPSATGQQEEATSVMSPRTPTAVMSPRRNNDEYGEE